MFRWQINVQMTDKCSDMQNWEEHWMCSSWSKFFRRNKLLVASFAFEWIWSWLLAKLFCSCQLFRESFLLMLPLTWFGWILERTHTYNDRLTKKRVTYGAVHCLKMKYIHQIKIIWGRSSIMRSPNDHFWSQGGEGRVDHISKKCAKQYSKLIPWYEDRIPKKIVAQSEMN